ncbi:hypothetical protein [Nonomuraea mesophila]|uniref:hypothetical protein n=1 Tax=Nonomuraea mesophila TaxID=2530382 RepID=UPI00140AE6F7|nr:hypothetical protein [Nonomuraea mesophila]
MGESGALTVKGSQVRHHQIAGMHLNNLTAEPVRAITHTDGKIAALDLDVASTYLMSA